ncbi:ExeM/NucH family extracellular endonuclease [Deinococcus sp.]|uniref:ExeM/NucH family extracellular endonuclease n=1 Tax=Deinococcus sp. TaxID=47478 RepID=UPI003C7D606E
MKTSFALLTSLSLLLAACGQSGAPTTSVTPPVAVPTTNAPAPVTTPPTASQPGVRPSAVYELTFQGANGGSGQVTASARFLGGLNTQGLSNGPDTLKFERLSSETFVTDGDSKRHVRATFRVTNTGAAAIGGLTLVPVDTDDTDGDAGNNATPPTVGSTPFSKVSYFDGSDASAKAGSITPTGGKRFNAATGRAETDPGASAFLTGQDVSRLTATPPAGLSIAGIKDYGWKVADTLAPGASANVTFAVDLPAAPSPKNDPFTFSLVFTNAQTGPTAIHDVQGSTPGGDAPSPLNGKNVTVQGVVTADYQGSGQLGGFFIQAPDAEADSDPSTSEGIFVLCGAACKDVSVGDSVTVSGTVTEFNTVTELNAVSAVTVDASNVALPAPQTLTLPAASLNDYEKYEGMRVRVQGVVTENYKLGRGGVVKVADARIPSYTQINAPSVSGFAAYLDAIKRRTLVIDDGSTAQNPATVYGRGNQPLSAANTLRTGDTADVTGVLHYGFDYTNTPDTWRVESTPQGATFNGPARPAAPTVSGNMTVASANVLNFFTTLVTSNADADNGGAPCTPGGTDAANSRGANDCFEYKRQLAKVVSNLAGLNADVIGLMEVQNNATIGSGTDSLGAIVSALNTRLGGDIYAAIGHPDPGTDFIRVAMIYKKASVTPIGAPLTDTDPVNNRFPLAQVFQAAGGSQFAVVVNHLKSKGSGTGADADLLDGQGASANRRELQIARLLDLIQNKIVVGRGVSDVISVGDYNAYDMEPSLAAFRKGLDGVAGSADDLSPVFDSSVYSYQFDSQFGSLDHAFVTQSLKARGVNGEKWHDNSDEPTVLDYNREFKTAAQVGTTAATGTFFDAAAYRSSDHDPLKVGFTLPALATLGVTPSGNASATVNQPYTLNTPTTGTPDRLSIDWGDGTTETGLPGTTTSRTHTYAATGPVTIVVTVTRGGATAGGTQIVTVNPAPTPTVSLTSSGDLTFTAGATNGNTDTITVTASNGGTPVALSASVTPRSGATGTLPGVSFSPANVSGSAGGSSTATVSTAADTFGTYTVTVTGTGDASAQTSFDVTVSAPATTSPGKMVISEFRFRGPSGASDEFIELFNAGNSAVDISGWKIDGNTNNTANWSNRFTIPANITLQPRQFYLLTNAAANGYSLGVTGNGTYTTGITDNRAVRLTDAGGTVKDLVGFATAGATSATLCEGTCVADAATTGVTTQLSFKRVVTGTTLQDTDNNAADFVFTGTGANPQNTSSVWNNQN